LNPSLVLVGFSLLTWGIGADCSYDRNPASIYSISLLLFTIGVIISLVFAPRKKRQILNETIY